MSVLYSSQPGFAFKHLSFSWIKPPPIGYVYITAGEFQQQNEKNLTWKKKTCKNCSWLVLWLSWWEFSIATSSHQKPICCGTESDLIWLGIPAHNVTTKILHSICDWLSSFRWAGRALMRLISLQDWNTVEYKSSHTGAMNSPLRLNNNNPVTRIKYGHFTSLQTVHMFRSVCEIHTILTSRQHLWYQVHVCELTFVSWEVQELAFQWDEKWAKPKASSLDGILTFVSLKPQVLGHLWQQNQMSLMTQWDRTGYFKQGRGLFLTPILPPCQFNTTPQI